jgi:NAD(P)-dependent dehydrogenase (short-subunit alcohol dehydrogenase family)
MAKLDGKITLISGGTSGIGAETAKLFQSEGATVVVTSSSERSLEASRCQRAAESPRLWARNFPHLAGWRSAVRVIGNSILGWSAAPL